jgi:hypothetical protein
MALPSVRLQTESAKLGEMYVAVARDASKPVEQALVKKRITADPWTV